MKIYSRWQLLIIFLAVSNAIVSQISFLPYQTIATGSEAEVVSIGDVNNDGLDDVVLGTGSYFDPVNDFKIFVFLQNMEGELNDPVIYPYPTTYAPLHSMTIADVNDDQLNDVIIGYGDSISIFIQSNSGNLDSIQTYFSGIAVYGIKTGDLNNDGLTDIAVSHLNEIFIRIFYQTPSGYNTLTYPKPAGGNDEIDVADLNSDALDDLVYMAGQEEGGIHVFLQNNSGTLNPYITYQPMPAVFFSLHGIAIGDLNGDNANDIAASRGGNIPTSRIVMWLQDTVSNFLESPVEIDAYDIPEPIEIADLNCDGANEIITVHGGWQSLSVFEQDNSGEYGSYQLFNLPYSSHYTPQGLSIGDINNDGKKDIAVADFSNGLVLLLNNSLPGDFYDIDTSVIIENISSDTISETTYFVEITSDTINNYLIIQTDEYSLSENFQLDSIQTDSLFIRSGIICSDSIVDTLTLISYTFDSTFLYTDTILLATYIDSILIVSDFKISPDVSGIKIYPNPTEDLIRIELPEPFKHQAIRIDVYNLLGNLIFHENLGIDQITKELDLESYPDGLYIITISINDYVVSRKIMKSTW